MIDKEHLKNLIETDFNTIVDEVLIKEINEIRIILIDKTFLDIWFSLKLKNRYSCHWERKFKDNTIYRHDNIPHSKWKYVTTFPKHFHNRSEANVEESHISEEIIKGTYQFMRFVKESGIVNQNNDY
jgi:hypothetical protein